MNDTTRKISNESILLLDELKLHLIRRGIKMNQKKLISASIAFVVKHHNDFFRDVQKHKDNTKEQTDKFLRHAKKFDFGSNWKEEIDTSL